MSGGEGKYRYWVNRSEDLVIKLPNQRSHVVYADVSWDLAAGSQVDELRGDRPYPLKLSDNAFARFDRQLRRQLTLEANTDLDAAVELAIRFDGISTLSGGDFLYL